MFLYTLKFNIIKEFMTDELLKRNWDFDDLERVRIDTFLRMSLYFSNPEKYSLFGDLSIMNEDHHLNSHIYILIY